MKRLSLSPHLQEIRPLLRQCLNDLLSDFDYVSFLATDSPVIYATLDGTSSSLGESHWVERGVVCRLQKDGIIWEYSFNSMEESPATLAAQIRVAWQAQEEILKSQDRTVYAALKDNQWKEDWAGQVELSTFEENPENIFSDMRRLQQLMMETIPFISYAQVRFHSVEVHKVFISSEKDLSQVYQWSEGYMVGTLRRDEVNRTIMQPFSGLKGWELFKDFFEGLEPLAGLAEPLLNAGTIEQGEYDVILGPDVAGVLAHEAFGHGVETDTFVKGRALAADYLGKPVASDKVDMHDGALGVSHVSSYLFDDEGNRGTDQLVIEKGILKTGFGDELSLQTLGQEPTGNGKRESYKRKAYSRMTNTWFAPGEDSLEEMIGSIKKGYILEQYNSGMEDPKNWGIQLACPYGEEIIDGKRTGRLVAPVLLTGFVPQVLKDISMISSEVVLSGSGACGKGYKEYSKVSSGGPYIKTKMRLG